MMYLVLPAEQPEQFLDSGRVAAARAIEEIRPGQNLHSRLVLHDELAHELAIEPMHVVQRVEQRVAAAHAKEQRDLAQALLQIDDERRPLFEAGDVNTEVDGDGGGAGATLGAEEHDRLRILLARG